MEEKKEFGKEWQDEQREKMVRIQFPKTIKRIEDRAREEVIKEIKVVASKPYLPEYMNKEDLVEIIISKLTTK